MQTFEVTLTLPPTLNHIYRHSGRRVFKPANVVAWEQESGSEINKAKHNGKTILGDVEVWVDLYLKRDRDIDSSTKLLFDLLQKQRVIENDRQIIAMHVFKFVDKINPRLFARLTKTD